MLGEKVIGLHHARKTGFNRGILSAWSHPPSRHKVIHAQGDSDRRCPGSNLDRLHGLAALRPTRAGSAIETRDVGTVTRHVYFDAVRVSLSNQVIAAYARRAGIQISPLAQSMAAAALGIADPIVKKLISPEALSELLAVGWPATVVPDPPPGTVGITRSTIGTIWQIFGNSEYGIGRFEVSPPALLPPPQRFRLTFRLLQWRWRLVDVTLPENIQNLLGDELIKAMRTPARKP
jgi:hypothetical protein